MILKTTTDDTPSAVLDQCRNGHELHIELPDDEIVVTAECEDVYYTYYATREDGSETEVEGVAVWKLISDHDVRIE